MVNTIRGEEIMETKYAVCPKCTGIPISLAIERKFERPPIANTAFLANQEQLEDICEFILGLLVKSNFNTTCANCSYDYTAAD